jgi:hypothetical protein
MRATPGVGMGHEVNFAQKGSVSQWDYCSQNSIGILRWLIGLVLGCINFGELYWLDTLRPSLKKTQDIDRFVSRDTKPISGRAV